MALHLGGLPSSLPARVTSPGTSSLFRELVRLAGYVSHPFCSLYAMGSGFPLFDGDFLINLIKGIPLGTTHIVTYLFTDPSTVD